MGDGRMITALNRRGKLRRSRLVHDPARPSRESDARRSERVANLSQDRQG